MRSGFTRQVQRALLISAVLGWTGEVGPIVAQEKGTTEVDPTLGRTQGLLPGRNRATLHPGKPLNLVGLEQGDHDLRSGTPALAQSDRTVMMVNPDESRRRALAMYEEGASFHQALPSRAQAWSSFSNGAPAPAPYSPSNTPATGPHGNAPPATDEAVKVDSAPGKWTWVLSLSAAACLAVWILKRDPRKPHTASPVAARRKDPNANVRAPVGEPAAVTARSPAVPRAR